jgi:hypothetical protein
MNSYILLRNNKESSSLNLEALLQSGLKSTDLIWVECQSVCWQHPHEIAELKALMADSNSQPVVEQVKSQLLESSNNADEIIPEKTVENKLVFVELPASPASVDLAKKQSNEDVLSDLHKYGGLSVSEKQPSEKKPDDISIKYSRPLDEIKEMYVKNLEKQNKSQKAGIKIKLPKEFKKIAVYAGLVVAGAGLMLLINNIGGKKSSAIAQQNLQQNTVTKPVEALQSEPVQNSIQEPVVEQSELPADEAATPTVEKETLTLPVKKSTVEKKESESKATTGINKEKIEKDIQEVKEAIVSKPVSTESISSKLSLKANDYVVGSFGGIRNLEITLQNDSKYLLDKVAAELQYLNPEGLILKTENIYFQSVSPGQKETVAVKKSKRGVKINYKITSIESRGLNNGTAGL